MKRLLLLFVVAILASCSDKSKDIDSSTSMVEPELEVSFTAAISTDTRVTNDVFETGDIILVKAFEGSNAFGSQASYTYGGTSFEGTTNTIVRENETQELSYIAAYPSTVSSFGTNFSFTVNSDQSYGDLYEFSDLLVASCSATTETTPALTFKHALSSLLINFTFTGDVASAGTLKIYAKATADVDLSADTYVGSGSTVALTPATYGTNSYVVIFAPQTITAGDLVAEYTVTASGETYTWDMTNTMNFASSYRYTFGWAINTDLEANPYQGEVTYIGSSINGWNDKDLYDAIKVTFDLDGGTLDGESTYVADVIVENSYLADPGTPIKAGYTFEGWVDSDGEPFSFTTTPISENITIKATWEEYFPTVTVELDGGTLESLTENPFTVTYDETISLGTPTKAVSDFQGWYCDGAVFDFDTPITEDITLTAKWTSDYDDSWYIITDEADLQAFRTVVNEKTDTMAKAVLANDIYLTETNWTPIGVGTGFTGFSGTFDGNNKTIYDLKIDSDEGWRGLFGGLGMGAIIKDCTISGLDIKTTTYCNYGSIGAFAGGIAYLVAYPTTPADVTDPDVIAMCVQLSNLTVKNGTITGPATIGGIIGSTTRYTSTGAGLVGIFTNCTIESDVTITKNSSNSYVGGITGTARNSTTFTNCHNKGKIIATSGDTAGGITAGGLANTFIGCSNSGSMECTISQVGGIMGFNGATACSFIGCYNTGTISGNTSVGGIIGKLQNASDFYACYNSGTISATGSDSGAIAGVVGTATAGTTSTFTDCYYVESGSLTSYGGTSITLANAGDITAVSSIADLNSAVSAMNANSTFSAKNYYYVAGNDTTPPTVAAM